MRALSRIRRVQLVSSLLALCSISSWQVVQGGQRPSRAVRQEAAPASDALLGLRRAQSADQGFKAVGRVAVAGSIQQISTDASMRASVAALREMNRGAAEAQRVALGLRRATNITDLDLLFRDNLYPDMLPYQQRAARSALTGGAMGHLLRTTGRGRPWLLGVVAVRILAGRLTYAASKGLSPAFHTRLHRTARELEAHQARGLASLPDTLFLLNMHDMPLCPAGACSAPVFSLVKRWDPVHLNSSHDDVLVPFLIHEREALTHMPHGFKRDQAVLRAGIHRLMRNNSCRPTLLKLSASGEGKRWLDVGITDLRHESIQVPLVPRLPLEEHGRWRYLLSCDGNTASARLGKLLTVNSLVLKEESPWIEFYYRSLRANQHFVSFTPSSVVKVLERVSHWPAAEQVRIITNAQRFAYQYLSQHSRVLYFQKALTVYNDLFRGGMPEILTRIPEFNWTIGDVKALT